AIGLGASHRGVTLHVGDHEVELGAAERFDAAGFVDHLDRELCGSDAADADLCHAAGGRIKCADIDGIGSPAAERDCAECTCCECRTGLLQEFAAALPLRQSFVCNKPVPGRFRRAILGHAVSPDCGPPAGTSRPGVRFCLARHASAGKNCLQYSFQYYHHVNCPGATLRKLCRSSLLRGMMAAKLLKSAKMRIGKSREALRAPATALVIARSIEEDIVLGRRQPRERLVEQDLSDLFHTHRGDVRLALFELEKKGLVERIKNRRAMVGGRRPAEVKEIYAVREELEVMAVRIIPFPVKPADIARLEDLQREHAKAIADGEMLTVFYSNLRFHQALFGLCGNACLIET